VTWKDVLVWLLKNREFRSDAARSVGREGKQW
jgi:hypothetical protein